MPREIDYRQYKVLYVDDEPQALKYFEKGFSSQFDITTALSASDAWQIIEAEGDAIGVLITDQRMPGETGTELMGRVRKERPDIVRILTTAFSDLNSAVEAVNRGGAFRYVTKPWEPDELQGILKLALEFYLLRQDRDRLIREKLSVIQRMIALDRVRGLTALAASLEGRYRGSLGAFMSYVEQSPIEQRIEMDVNDVARLDLMTLARIETENLVTAVREVLSRLDGVSDTEETEVDLAVSTRELVNQISLAKAEDGVAIELEAPESLPTVIANPELISRMLRILIDRISDMDGEDRVVQVRLSANEQSDRITCRIIARAPAWKNGQIASLFSAIMPVQKWPIGIDMDILSAFFLAFHHGGNIEVFDTAGVGPGFQVEIATHPDEVERIDATADWFDRIFEKLERWRGPVPGDTL